MQTHCKLITAIIVIMIGVVSSGICKEAQVELKYMVPGGKIEETIKNLQIDVMKPTDTRVVCFYDTASRDLFNHKPQVILRSRYSTSGKQESDITVKIRGATVSISGARREFDQVIGREMVESWSLTSKPQTQVGIKNANNGIGIRKLFNKDQEKFIRETQNRVDWDGLIPFGPVIGVKMWNLTSIAGLRSITVERWELPEAAGKPKRVLFEVSTKVPVSNVANARMALSTALGFELVAGPDAETKTKLVMEHFSKFSRWRSQ